MSVSTGSGVPQAGHTADVVSSEGDDGCRTANITGYVSPMRPPATYDGTTDHSNPQLVHLKYRSNQVTAVTIGGPCE